MYPRNRPSQPYVIRRETEAQGHSVSNGSLEVEPKASGSWLGVTVVVKVVVGY